MTGQDMEIKQGSEGNSRAGEGRRRDWSGQGDKLRQQGELTNWRCQMPGLVRTRKQSEVVRGTHNLKRVDIGTGQDMETSEAARGTHGLEGADIRTGQDMETKCGSEGNSLAGGGRRQDWA